MTGSEYKYASHVPVNLGTREDSSKVLVKSAFTVTSFLHVSV